MSTAADIDAQIKDLRRRLAGLDQERAETAEKLRVLCHQREACNAKAEAIEHPAPKARVTSTSPAAEKIALFKSLFRGREDVFPRRWENPKTGKSGYAPACRNEWLHGICEKPRIKCGGMPESGFYPRD